ncbi:MAG TPA: helix-turn-helix transcriptional regulator [Solirubrobacterales bacterium]|nr:helix-turn-helix transcriptional regulator [Solirubrobacterales bacterium]
MALAMEILIDSGLSQAELARRAGMPRSVVNAYVRGKREPGSDALARLAAAAGFDLTLSPRTPPVDAERASKILVQVLELAEALPYRPKPELDYPRLPDRIAGGASAL